MGQCCSKSSIIDNNVILDSEKEIKLIKILHLNSESINSFTIKKKMFKGFNSRIYLLEKNQKLYIGKQYSSFKKQQLEIKILRENTFHKFPTLYQLYDTPQLHMIIYPYIKGQDIFEYYKHDLTMPEFELQQVIYQMAECIQHCHYLGIIHADIKPENFIITPPTVFKNLKVSLIDFGLSLDCSKRHPVRCKYIIGTLGYCAPDLFQGVIYKKSDIWSLGCILYLLITGNFPFTNDIDLFKQYYNDQDYWKEVKELTRHKSYECNDLLYKMLELDIDKRLTASEVLQHPWLQETTIVI